MQLLVLQLLRLQLVVVEEASWCLIDVHVCRLGAHLVLQHHARHVSGADDVACWRRCVDRVHTSCSCHDITTTRITTRSCFYPSVCSQASLKYRITNLHQLIAMHVSCGNGSILL